MSYRLVSDVTIYSRILPLVEKWINSRSWDYWTILSLNLKARTVLAFNLCQRKTRPSNVGFSMPPKSSKRDLQLTVFLGKLSAEIGISNLERNLADHWGDRVGLAESLITDSHPKDRVLWSAFETTHLVMMVATKMYQLSFNHGNRNVARPRVNRRLGQTFPPRIRGKWQLASQKQRSRGIQKLRTA